MRSSYSDLFQCDDPRVLLVLASSGLHYAAASAALTTSTGTGSGSSVRSII